MTSRHGEYLEAEITEIIDESPRVKRFVFRLVNVYKFEFNPGQFVIVDFPSIDDPLPYRSYSIASSNKRHKTLELCVSIKEDGKATPVLFSSKVGQRYTMSYPQGRFILPKNLDKDIYFICTGTGVAPFRSMLLSLLNNPEFKHNAHLYFGNRVPSDILYNDEFTAWEKEHDNFHYFPVLSQSDLSGRKGYVHEHYLPAAKNKPDAFFYICGWSEMVKEAKNNLKSLGYDRRSIKIEPYD